MKTAFYTLICAFAFFGASCSSPTRCDNAFLFSEDDIQYSVEFASPTAVRILAHGVGDTLETKRLVVLNRPHADLSIECKSDGATHRFVSDKIEVRFCKESKNFEFYDSHTDELILSERERKLLRDTIAGEACYRVKQSFVGDVDESIYGLGQYQTGVVDYKQDSVILLQSNKDIVNPYLISTRNFGILWDNYSSSHFVDSGDSFEFTSEVGDGVDYWFVYGENPDSLIAGYRHLTGAASMLPKWVFGFWQSKERYKSLAELESVAREYRKREIPIDVIVQDWEYWGDKPQWNSLKWDSRNFANPKQVISRLHNDYGLRVLLSVWPGFGAETEIYKDLEQIGALFDEPTWAGYKVFDAYNDKAREVFWQHFNKELLNSGIDGWWMDATEPSFREGFTQRRQEARSKSAGETAIGAFHRYLNTYSLVWLDDFYARLREAKPNNRPFIFTRSAFAGQQRDGMAVWSGDVVASWQGMKKQLAAGVNLAASGIPYWSFDIGGFFVTTNGGTYVDPLNDRDYKELYARWFQFGAFVPIFRAHGTNIPREIWQFGDEQSEWYKNQVKYIHLRYRLMPYIYSTAYQVANNDKSFMKALGVAFPQDRATAQTNDAYMFGESLLVRPIFEPLQGERQQQVTTLLPKHDGKWWYDFESGKSYRAGERVVDKYTISELPLFVRGGSILPMADVKQSVMLADEHLEIRIYSGASTLFTLYDDAGDGYQYLDGGCSKVDIEWDEDKQILQIGERAGGYASMPKEQNLSLRLYKPNGEIVEKSVKYNGESITYKF